MTSTSPRSSPANGPRPNAWNLLLLVPFLTLVTPWFNTSEPRLFGVPFFYWGQLVFVPVGVLCIAVVYAKNRTERVVPVAGGSDQVDDPGEGTTR
ncbi:MAG: DUF3311 domain-containing protein [Pseudonocardia sp.]|nr:DUF3311 domain-containing protein [Pseudonocardia sp.]